MPVPRRFDRRPPERDTTRINDRIRVPEVRLIDENGEQVGVMRTQDALNLAQSRDLDLVEVAPEAKPPVCRVLDYSKYKYEQAQKVKHAKKHQQQIVVREIKFRPKIAEHDYETKKGHVERFLRHKDKVKVTIMFRGREVTHPERGVMILERLAEDLVELCQIDQRPIQDGRNMTMLLSPSKAVLADALDEHPDDDVDLDALEDRDPVDGEEVVEAPAPKPEPVARQIQSDAEKENIVVTDDGNIVGAEDEPMGALPPPPKKKQPPAKKKPAAEKKPAAAKKPAAEAETAEEEPAAEAEPAPADS